jgi:hypothetical protein
MPSFSSREDKKEEFGWKKKQERAKRASHVNGQG